MLPLKKILCPLDFSEHSIRALKSACEMAEKFAAELELIHVITPFPIVPTTPQPMTIDVAKYHKELQDSSLETMKKTISENVPDRVIVHSIIITGDPAHEVIEHVKNNQIDLLVCSTHGHSSLKHLIFGSVAEKLVRHVSCPVLTIKIT